MSLLAHTIIEADDASVGRPVLYILHGFLGAGRNWSSFGRRLVELRPDWTVSLVDLRLHGDSGEAAGPHTVAAAADDLVELRRASDPERPVAVLGHSFGGKVALEASRRLDPRPVQTWVIDSTPSARSASGTTERLLSHLEESPPSFDERRAAVKWVESGGFSESTARWVATNLQKEGGALSWRLDLPGLRQLLDDFAAADLWPVLEAAQPAADFHVVRAGDESIVSPEDESRLEELAARGEPVRLHELAGGHWLHIDNPSELLDLVSGYLPRF